MLNGIQRRTSGAANPALRQRAPSGSPAILELVHVTAVGAAREIVFTGKIEARKCKVFGVDLAYFFVARPCYRLKGGGLKSDQINRFPFVFICSPERLGDPHHVYPFDTGAATSGIFQDKADPYVFLEDYSLDQSTAAIASHIEWAFETPSNYLDGTLRPGVEQSLERWETVARSYFAIAHLAASGHNQPDKRASTIEVAFSKHISLYGNAKFAIIPKQYLESASAKNAVFLKSLSDLSIGFDTYDWQPNETPDSFLEEISRLVQKYLRAKGQI